MQDFYERNIDYLRLSITDRCNHRCFYCTCNNLFLKEENLMTYDEVNLISQFFYELGIKCIRITGGEPLLRNDVVRIVKALSSRFTVSMTTNGSKLSQLAKDLKDAGLHSLNISLNSLKQETFYKITHARLKPVLAGIDRAIEEKMNVKLNVVVNHMNFDELPDLVEYAFSRKIPIRFIEMMPIGKQNTGVVFEKQILEKLSELNLSPVDIKLGFGPARYFVTKDGNYIGVISALSKAFCNTCNKLRVSCDGKLYPCLGSDFFIDLLAAVRKKIPESEILNMIIKSVEKKPFSHNMVVSQVKNKMNRLGG